jgi:hypothetical protein
MEIGGPFLEDGAMLSYRRLWGKGPMEPASEGRLVDDDSEVYVSPDS